LEGIIMTREQIEELLLEWKRRPEVIGYCRRPTGDHSVLHPSFPGLLNLYTSPLPLGFITDRPFPSRE
jgi:hypothetical protein